MRTMPEVLKLLEEAVADMDQFVEEVDCGDDWFCIYGSELGGLQKILTYAREQIQIQADFEARMIEQIKQQPTLRESVEYAIRSVEMELGPMSPESRALMERVANGEITTDQARAITHEKAQRLAKKNGA